MSEVMFQVIKEKADIRKLMDRQLRRYESKGIQPIPQWNGFAEESKETASIRFMSQGYIWFAGTDEQICNAVDEMGGIKHFSEFCLVNDPDNSLQFCEKTPDPDYYLWEVPTLVEQLQNIYIKTGVDVDGDGQILFGDDKKRAGDIKLELAKYNTPYTPPLYSSKTYKIPTSQSGGVAKIKKSPWKQA